MIDKTESAVETLRDAMTIRNGCDCFAMGAEEYRDMLDRVIDAPVDADGNVLHVGDEVTSWGFDGARRVTSFRLFESGWWDVCVDGVEEWPCSDLRRVTPDSRERIEADAVKGTCDYFEHGEHGCAGCPAEHSHSCSIAKSLDLVRRCLALMDGGAE